MRSIKSILLALVVCFSFQSNAFVSPVSLNVMPPVQFPPDDFSVAGARVSAFWGRHRDVYGLDLAALGNITDQRFIGIGVAGGFNWTKGDTSIIGLQAAGIGNFNTNKTNVYGLQVALGINYMSAESSIYGLGLALLNITPHTKINGFQVGLYNRALVVRGFQIGLVNVADSLYGIQIGLVNMHRKGIVAVSPIINIGF